MKSHKLCLVFSALALSALLLGACGPADIVSLAAGGNCPPGYIPVYDEQVGSPGYCQLNPNPPLTVTVPANGKCPPGYHKVTHGEFPELDYCELIPTPTPTSPPQALDSGPPIVKPVMLTVTMPANGICPPGYHKVSPAGYEFPELDYCELDPTPTPTPPPQALDSGPPIVKPVMLTVTVPANGECPYAYHYVGLEGVDEPTVDYCELDATPTPPAQAPNSGIPDLKPAIEVVQYCANKGANLGGVNIAFPLESSMRIDEWFSESPGHVKCVDDLSNPRTCWGPESATFEVLLCNTDFVQNEDYACKTLPVTLGSCASDRKHDNQPDPIPTSCVLRC